MCRIVGILGSNNDIMTRIVYALVAQNYAANKSCGFAIGNHTSKCVTKDGLVHQQLSHLKPSDFRGRSGIGHVSCEIGMKMPIALGNNAFLALDGTEKTAKRVIKKIQQFTNIETAVANILSTGLSPFALVILTPSKIIAARNNGRMPLSFGKMIDDKGDGNGYYVASQSGVLGKEGEYIHSVFPGEMVILRPRSYIRKAIISRPDITRCFQEVLFYQRPDNYCGGRQIHGIRLDIGKALGEKFHRFIKVENPKQWITIPILQGGADIINGFGQTAGIPINPAGSVKSSYLINPKIPIPNDGYAPIKEVVKGKRVVIVDDGLIGGRRIEIMARLSLEHGAIECYAAVATLIRSSCVFGKDISNALESLNGLEKRSHVQQILFLTPKELIKAVNNSHRIYCGRCLWPSG